MVAIDGPSGAGKSTVARALARELGFAHLDTGAMFRAIAWFLLERGHACGDSGAGDSGPGDSGPGDASPGDAVAARALVGLRLELDGRGQIAIDGRTPTAELRTPRVDAAVSAVSALPSVRARLRDLQREFAERGPLVCEGRDMGTVVFPDAAFKFYLDASVGERARRRAADFRAQGRTATVADVEQAIASRDGQDESRAIAPLRAAEDAVRVDTTGMTVDEVVARLARDVRARLAVAEGDA